MGRLTQEGLIKMILRSSIDQNDPAGYHVFQPIIYSQNIARIANAVQVTFCLLVSTSVY